jgi:hypothetical protein
MGEIIRWYFFLSSKMPCRRRIEGKVLLVMYIVQCTDEWYQIFAVVVGKGSPNKSQFGK